MNSHPFSGSAIYTWYERLGTNRIKRRRSHLFLGLMFLVLLMVTLSLWVFTVVVIVGLLLLTAAFVGALSAHFYVALCPMRIAVDLFLAFISPPGKEERVHGSVLGE